MKEGYEDRAWRVGAWRVGAWRVRAWQGQGMAGQGMAGQGMARSGHGRLGHGRLGHGKGRGMAEHTWQSIHGRAYMAEHVHVRSCLLIKRPCSWYRSCQSMLRNSPRLHIFLLTSNSGRVVAFFYHSAIDFLPRASASVRPRLLHAHVLNCI